MNGYGIRNATTRRLAGTRRPAARIAGPALLLLMVTAVALPAQAATATPTTATATTATAAASTPAGTTWSQLMRRKLNLRADSARLTALLPVLRTAATKGNLTLGQARKAQTAAATTLTTASTADQNARIRYAAAKTAATEAKKAVTAALKRRPRISSTTVRAKRALTAANASLRAQAIAGGQTASALNDARTAYTSATKQVTTATAAYQTATKAVSDTEQTLRSLPRLDSALAAQTVAISEHVVTQSRASFTIDQTTQVYGVTVNKIIAFPVQRMIDDAAKAGINLSGGGFRTKQQQIALRIANGCPDVWTAPSSSCKVPTAIPGRSLHELGLAIDLTSGKKSINDRKSAAFIWLAANAGRYGLVNLPSEPWHWSVTGH